MRSLTKNNRQPGRNQFQALKRMWAYKHLPPFIKTRGKNIGMFLFMMYAGYLVFQLLTPSAGLFRISLFHIMN